ncbi:MAG: family 1 glycosylhydrolase [Acidimicrobiales bacterium]
MPCASRRAMLSAMARKAKVGSASPGETSRPLVPESFYFGVAMSGFQVEGGFNGPGEPSNNWLWWERAGRVEPSGIAVDFWNRYEEQLDRVVALGCNMVRLGVEWARLEPVEGEIDSTALDRYQAMLSACHERGITPLVTLHHFTHPAWLGEDFWLEPGSSDRFATWVDTVVPHLAPSCRHWVTLNEMNVLAMGSYLLGIMPPGRRLAAGDALCALDNLLAAHVKAYGVLHRLQPDAMVTTNNSASSVYELDRMLVDILGARSAGVSRDELGVWLAERRGHFYRDTASAGPIEALVRGAGALGLSIAPSRRGLAGSSLSEVMARRSGIPGRSLDAVYASEHERALDMVGIDYYDPVVSHHIQLPGSKTAGGRSWEPARMLWDDVVDPAGLIAYCRANASDGLPVWVVENGLCNRVRNGRAFPRRDGWDRIRYLRENLAAVVAAMDAGWQVGAYLHWSLVDNYEWGSYEPRFGIHGVDRERGFRVLATDSMGADAAGAYRRLIDAVRSGDRSALAGSE